MKPEKKLLIHDLLDHEDWEAHREATLLAGGRFLRHRRWKRAVVQSLAVVAVITMVAVSFLIMNAPRPSAETSAPPAPAQIHYLSDDELLALFPNTPIGLATVDGKKLLIFLRPGDQERFVGRF